jgi:ADP-ribose pyrophosphatase
MRITKSRKMTDLKWLNMFDVTFVGQDGREGNWQMATRQKEPKCITGDFDRPDAVVIVPLHIDSSKVVITREYRVPLAGCEYGFPAGLIDQGETVEEAVRRELREETGLNVTRFLKIGPPIYSSAGMTDESVSMVYVECEGVPSTDGNEGTEQIEVLLMSREEVSRLCKDWRLKFDAKAWLVLTQYAEHGFTPGFLS